MTSVGQAPFKQQLPLRRFLHTAAKISRLATDGAFFLLRHPRELSLVPAWLRTLFGERDPLKLQTPWMPIRAVRWLDGVVRPDFVVFEYGAGGSTLYFARKAKAVWSVEHEPDWHQAVVNALDSLGRKNCECALIRPEQARDDKGCDPSDPAEYRTSIDPTLSFERYASYIDRFSAGTFDLVLIDGRARPSCIKHAASKVKPGGYLLLDDSNRRRYCRAIRLLERWELTDLAGFNPTGIISRTTAWKKPASEPEATSLK